MERWRESYLDFDKLLDPVDDEDVVFALWTLADDGFVAGPQPPVLKSLFVRLLVVQVAQDDCGPAEEEFAWFVVLAYVVAVGIDYFCF